MKNYPDDQIIKLKEPSLESKSREGLESAGKFPDIINILEKTLNLATQLFILDLEETYVFRILFI